MVDNQLKNKVKEKKMKKILAKVDKFKNNQRPKIVSFEDFDDLVSNEVNTEDEKEDHLTQTKDKRLNFSKILITKNSMSFNRHNKGIKVLNMTYLIRTKKTNSIKIKINTLKWRK